MFRFEQLAVYVADLDMAIRNMATVGLDDWIRDDVTAMASVLDETPSSVKRRDVTFQAGLAFNYQAMTDTEFELIMPMSPDHYLNGATPGNVAHVGIHIDPGDVDAREKAILAYDLGELLQSSRTTNHTNPAVGDRRYSYDIYRSGKIPVPVKLIERIEAAV